MGAYNCRVRFENGFGTGDFPVIGGIYCKFTYYNGETSEQNRSVQIRPGGQEFIFSRFDDDPARECVKNIEVALSWFFEDGSTDSGGGEIPAEPDTCTTAASVTLNTPSFLREGYKCKMPPVEITVSDHRAMSGKRVVWSSESEASKRHFFKSLKPQLAKT